MSNEGDHRSLSGKFYDNAKDDPEAQQRRTTEAINNRLGAFGAEGEKAQLGLDRQRDHMVAGEVERQIKDTSEQRQQQKMLQGIREAGGAPEPGRATAPLSPAQHQQIKEHVTGAISRENAELEERIRFEAQEARNRIGQKIVEQLERQHGRGREQGRDKGQGRDDL